MIPMQSLGLWSVDRLCWEFGEAIVITGKTGNLDTRQRGLGSDV
jgi:hypothetical protein